MYVTDVPAEHPSITSQEVRLIESDRTDHAASSHRSGGGSSDKSPPAAVPWSHMLRSMPFWAIFVGNFGNNWGFQLMMTELPEYLKTMLHYNIKDNALLSALPYLCMWGFSFCCGYAADKLREKQIVGTTAARKIATFIAHGLPAVCLFGICFTGCNGNATVVLLTLAVMFQGAMLSGTIANPLDIAPNYAGTILGITNGFGDLSGWLAPLTAGAFTKDSQTLASWRKVWSVTIAIYLVDVIFYMVFASGNEQYWNTMNTSDETTAIIPPSSSVTKSPGHVDPTAMTRYGSINSTETQEGDEKQR